MNERVQDPPPTGTRRREARSSWQRSIDGQLYLNLSDAESIPVDTLRNVSARGANVVIGQELDIGTSVSVAIEGPGVKLAFMANVIWCREDAVAGDAPAAIRYAVGLELLGPGSFAAMLDAFTGT